MHKTDVEGIEILSNGILINVKSESSYHQQRIKAMEEIKQKERINNMEKDIASMREMLSTILTKLG